MVDWLSLAIPFAYLGVLIGSLATFSSLYRQRKAAKARSLAPWFPPSLPRNVYLSLLHIEPSAQTGGKPIPDSVLKAALMRRATEAIKRLITGRSSEQALQQLLQRGSVGDDLWQRFLRGKEDIEAECRDIAQEANAFSAGWDKTIFQSANEINQNILLRSRIEEIQAQVDSERQWWEGRKASIQADFMKELDSEKTVGGKPATGKPPAAPTMASSEKPGSSDEDAVLVEVDRESKAGGQPIAGGGGGKKKKGKK